MAKSVGSRGKFEKRGGKGIEGTHSILERLEEGREHRE